MAQSPAGARTPTGVRLEVDDATLLGWLADDLGEPPQDATTDPLFPAQARGRAAIVAREALVVSGLDEALRLFRLNDVEATPMRQDGDEVETGARLARVEGATRAILRIERTALNILGRMSGIASMTRSLQERVARVNPACRVAATRKTTPGFRVLEKKAVWQGGGDPHRYGLFDQVLVKDNHRAAASDLGAAMKRLRAAHPDLLLEVEVENEADAQLAAQHGADILLLDNLPPHEGAAIAEAIRAIAPGIRIEASGGITPENIESYARFADRVSLGRLTQGAAARDVALDWETS